MGSTSSKKNYLQVSIYWGGAELGSYCRPLSSSRGVTAGHGFFSDIKSVIWPRWDSLEIISKTKSGLVLNPNIPWDGVLSSGQTTHILKSLKSSRKFFEIKPGTTASLRLDDMSIAIRVGPKIGKEQSRVKPASGFGASPFSFIAEKPSEWISLAAAVLAAGIITVSAHQTLKSRDNDLYQGIAELPNTNLLPFIAQKHLAEAPNVIQFTLDRFNYVHSVWNYYTDFATVVGFGKSNEATPMIFQSTIDQYKGFFDQQRSEIALAEGQQKIDIQKLESHQGAMSIPMVRGETVEGKILRVLDKIGLYSASARELAAKRVTIAEEFENDIGFAKGEKTEGPKNEAFAKIAQGYLGIESDDKMQESQARNSAARAALAQIDLFGEGRLKFGSLDCCDQPAGAPLTQTGVTWTPADYAGLEALGSLAALKGSTWGVPVKEEPKIQEPVFGHIDPSTIEKTVSAGRYQLRLCYELALRRNQAAKGSMEWRWKINTQGRISNIDLLHSSIKDEELARCIHDKIATWKFSKPKGGSVEVRYPFEFSRDKG